MSNDITITFGSELVIRQTLPEFFMVVNLAIDLKIVSTNPSSIIEFLKTN